MKGEMKGRKITEEELKRDGWEEKGVNFEGYKIFRKVDSKILWDEKSQMVKDKLEGEIEARLRDIDTKPT